jgi:hypothetical protein
MRFSLRTLIIVMLLGGPVCAGLYRQLYYDVTGDFRVCAAICAAIAIVIFFIWQFDPAEATPECEDQD